MTRIKIKLNSEDASIPRYAHGSDADSGMDLVSVESVALYAHVPRLVRTGLSIELPPGYEGQVRSRSGMALKRGICVYNAPGTVDPSYRGDLGVILCWNGMLPAQYDNDGVSCVWINAGERIAQLVIARYEAVEFVEAELADSTRGERGYGSTGA